MSYTMEEFKRDFLREHFNKLSREEQREILQSMPPEEHGELLHTLPRKELQEVLESLPPEERLAGMSPEQIRRYLDQLGSERPVAQRKPRKKK